MEGLEEMMTICSMCNDSSVDFNEVGEKIDDSRQISQPDEPNW